jgi:hypothetical protein
MLNEQHAQVLLHLLAPAWPDPKAVLLLLLLLCQKLH